MTVSAMTGAVLFEDGILGEVSPKLHTAVDENPHTEVRLEDGRQVEVPTDLLVLQADDTYTVRLRASDLPFTQNIDETMRIVPVVQEFAEVQKRAVETGRVRVTKAVTEREEVIDEPLTRTTAEIERVPIGRLVDTAPEARQEGDTLVISIVEEVLVVEKRLRLVEEVRITKRRSEHHAPQMVTLRREEVSVEHVTSE